MAVFGVPLASFPESFRATGAAMVATALVVFADVSSAARAVARVLAQVWDERDGLLLVDCLGMWLMRFFGPDDSFDEVEFARQRQWLLEAIDAVQGRLLLVTNEIGWGVMPMSRMARLYGDLLGRLNQDVAARCQHVTLVACGLPLSLKGG